MKLSVLSVWLLFVIMTHGGALLAFSRRSGRLLVARAFTATTTTTRTRSFTTKTITAAAANRRRLVAAYAPSSTQLLARATNRRNLSASSSTSATVEEDLDAALDSLLGEQQQQQQSKNGSRNGKQSKRKSPISSTVLDLDDDNEFDDEENHHMKNSKPMPSTLLEEDDPVDFHDPKFLSTSNPIWIEKGMDPLIIDALSQKGISQFTPVQAEAFDPVLARRDVIGQSRTGTGKTLAFGIPAMLRLVKFTEDQGWRNPNNNQMMRGRPVSMVVLCPTRELARQVSLELGEVARPLKLYVDVFHGGVSYGPQANALRNGLDVLVGTPGRIIDHLERGNLDLSHCDIAVLDEADEMLNMGFADDVERILDGFGSANEDKTQCLMFSATTPPWVKQIGRKYQQDVLAIDSTSEEGGPRVATTVRHTAVQLPPGQDSKLSILEDLIAVEISKDKKIGGDKQEEEDSNASDYNAVAAAARAKSGKTMSQKIFGKTIVFTETKREADELVSGSIFKSLTAQALHGDVGQKQRDATLAAFRKGAFNVLVATDVTARGIDIKDVDLVVQFDPPRDADTYVHRSGRTGRAGQKGVSVVMFNRMQARDIVRIERDLGHNFKFELVGPPSTEAALHAAAKTSAIACKGVPDETAAYFNESAAVLLEEYDDPQEVVARCLAAISRRASQVESRSLITGEAGVTTLEMKNNRGRPVAPNDVMFTVGKLARMSRGEAGENGTGFSFDADIGKIQANFDSGTAFFDMSVEDAKNLVEFSKGVDAGGSEFTILKEMEIERDRNFGRDRNGQRGRFNNNNRGYSGRGGGGGNRNYRDNNNRGRYNKNDDWGSGGNYRGSYGRGRGGGDHSHTGQSNRGGGYRGGYSQRGGHNQSQGGGYDQRGGRNQGGGYNQGGRGDSGFRGRYDGPRRGGGDSW